MQMSDHPNLLVLLLLLLVLLLLLLLVVVVVVGRRGVIRGDVGNEILDWLHGQRGPGWPARNPNPRRDTHTHTHALTHAHTGNERH